MNETLEATRTGPMAVPPPPLLSINNIEVVYDDVILVLRGLSLEVPKGAIVALLGANGAGKSTTLKAISGLLKTEDGEVTRGEILFEGQRINGIDPDKIVRRGIFQVMEGRRIVADMTSLENLRLGAFTRRDGEVSADIDMVFKYFPRLKERTGLAGYLSGGEQQMLAIGRALMARPKMILMDEPSMGLSPLLVKEVFAIIKEINRDLASRSSWSSRMRARRSRSQATATSWNRARWCSTAPPTSCATTRTSRNSTSAAPATSARASRI